MESVQTSQRLATGECMQTLCDTVSDSWGWGGGEKDTVIYANSLVLLE